MNHESSWRFFLLAGLVALSVEPGYAQTGGGHTFTLDECISYALQNATNAHNATIDEQIAEARVKETVGIGLPQVSGSASLVHNQQLQRIYGIYNDDPDGFSFFPPGIPGAQNGDVLAAENFFQLKSSGNVGLSINQLLFNGSYFVGLQAASTYRELATKAKAQTQEQIIEQVTKAYYNVLINKERAELFNNNIARMDTLLQNTTALNQSGFAEQIDVDRIRVSFNNLKAERDNFLNLNELSLQLLKFQMNYAMDQPLEVAGNIQEVNVAYDIENLQEDWEYGDRPDYQLLEVNKRLQQLNIKNLYAELVPSIGAFASLGYATQSDGIGGLFKTNSAVPDGEGIGPDKWYGYSQFGINMNIPIFAGLQSNYKIQQQKLELLKIDNSFEALKDAIDLEIAQASVNYRNAIKSLESQRENQELAGNVARVTKIKYEEGVGSNLEVVDAENSLRTAQINYYIALFDAIMAKIDLEKALGQLNK